MKLMLMSLFFLSSFSFSQDTQQMMKEFFEMRKKMMQKMQESFKNDSFFNDSFFDDDMMSGFDTGFFKGTMEPQVDIAQIKKSNGDIEIKITPKNKNIKIDIDTNEESITIKSKSLVEQKDESTGTKNIDSFFQSSSMSSRTISIPLGYEMGSPKKDGNSIVYLLKPKKKGRRPLRKIKGQQTI